MPGRFGFGSYLKAAFLNRWNLLGFLGGSLAALIGPASDVTLPLVAAAELFFLGALVTNQRFQRAIETQADAKAREHTSADMLQRFNQLLYGLDQESREMFQQLRARCASLVGTPSADGEKTPPSGLDAISAAHLEGVNRLLWVYLKLLHTRRTLERFLHSIDEKELNRSAGDIAKRLAQLPADAAGAADEIAQKMRRSLADTQATLTARKNNLKRAQDNYAYVEVELERIATKLTALAEMAVNRQDPALITNSVDDVARSVESTEQAIGELQVFTGLTPADDAAPPILDTPSLAPQRSVTPPRMRQRGEQLH